MILALVPFSSCINITGVPPNGDNNSVVLPETSVRHGIYDIASGGIFYFATISVDPAAAETFTIHNGGDADLDLDGALRVYLYPEPTLRRLSSKPRPNHRFVSDNEYLKSLTLVLRELT